MEDKPKVVQKSVKIVGLPKDFKVRKRCPEVTDIAGFRYEYWYAFISYLEKSGSGIETGNDPAKVENLFHFPTGRTDIHLSAYLEWDNRQVSVILWMPLDRYSKDWTRDLRAACGGEIRKQYGDEFVWGRTIYNPHGHGAFALSVSLYIDITDRDTWNTQFQWYIDQVTIFRRVFGTWIRETDLERYRVPL